MPLALGLGLDAAAKSPLTSTNNFNLSASTRITSVSILDTVHRCLCNKCRCDSCDVCVCYCVHVLLMLMASCKQLRVLPGSSNEHREASFSPLRHYSATPGVKVVNWDIIH